MDEMIPWNDIKQHKNLQFKTIDDEEIMEEIIADQNSYHFNQAEGTPMTIELFVTLIETNVYTSFSKELLEGIVNLS